MSNNCIISTLNAIASAVAKTVLLMHFNGNYSDETGKTMSATGSFGYGSGVSSPDGSQDVVLTNAGSGFTTPASSDFNFGTGDFTIECFFYNTNSSSVGQRALLSCSKATGNNGIVLGFDPSNSGVFVRTANGNILAPSGSASTGKKNHVAYSRNNGTGRLFVNGQLQATVTDNNIYSDGVCGIGVTQVSSVLSWYGYMDDVRITKGLGRYTSNFAMPTTALTL